MAQVLKVPSWQASCTVVAAPARRLPSPSRPYASVEALVGSSDSRWAALRREVSCEGRHRCFFSDGRKKEQAKKALESALGEKKTELEKWNREIEKRQEKGGGGTSGRGGWFGGGGWFGWFGDDNFWEEAKQAVLTIVGIISLYLLLAKGNVMFAVIFNSLLFVLRGVRNWFTSVSSFLSNRTFAPASGPGTNSTPVSNETYETRISAKERVIRKWGSD